MSKSFRLSLEFDNPDQAQSAVMGHLDYRVCHPPHKLIEGTVMLQIGCDLVGDGLPYDRHNKSIPFEKFQISIT
jgi:hypothetical protein